jgi:hypothetical protein
VQKWRREPSGVALRRCHDATPAKPASPQKTRRMKRCIHSIAEPLLLALKHACRPPTRQKSARLGGRACVRSSESLQDDDSFWAPDPKLYDPLAELDPPHSRSSTHSIFINGTITSNLQRTPQYARTFPLTTPSPLDVQLKTTAACPLSSTGLTTRAKRICIASSRPRSVHEYCSTLLLRIHGPVSTRGSASSSMVRLSLHFLPLRWHALGSSFLSSLLHPFGSLSAQACPRIAFHITDRNQVQLRGLSSSCASSAPTCFHGQFRHTRASHIASKQQSEHSCSCDAV